MDVTPLLDRHAGDRVLNEPKKRHWPSILSAIAALGFLVVFVGAGLGETCHEVKDLNFIGLNGTTETVASIAGGVVGALIFTFLAFHLWPSKENNNGEPAPQHNDNHQQAQRYRADSLDASDDETQVDLYLDHTDSNGRGHAALGNRLTADNSTIHPNKSSAPASAPAAEEEEEAVIDYGDDSWGAQPSSGGQPFQTPSATTIII